MGPCLERRAWKYETVGGYPALVTMRPQGAQFECREMPCRNHHASWLVGLVEGTIGCLYPAKN